jgi:hypothetical protein
VEKNIRQKVISQNEGHCCCVAGPIIKKFLGILKFVVTIIPLIHPEI